MAVKKYGAQKDVPVAHMDIVNRGSRNDMDERGTSLDVGTSGTGKKLFAGKKQGIINGAANLEEPLAYGSVTDEGFGPPDEDTSWHTSQSKPGRSRGHELEGGDDADDGQVDRRGVSGRGTLAWKG